MTEHRARRRRQSWIALVLCCLLAMALVMAVMVRFILRRTAWITLPDTRGGTGVSVSDPVGQRAYPVEITPRTVQAAVATLSRPARDCRNVTVTQYWDGGDSSYTATVTVSAPWTRVDLPLGAGRHSLTDGQVTYLWYDGDSAALRMPAGSISADNEQHIPTYEDVLGYPEESILLADYRTWDGIRCVYMETLETGEAADAGENRLTRWWISVEDGVLVAAEVLADGEAVYQMEASETREPAPEAFTLPGGTAPPEMTD